MIKSAKPSAPTVVMPAAMPTLNSEAANHSPNKVIAGVLTGDLPESEAIKQRKRGQRGPDVNGSRKFQKRGPRKCKLCEQWAPDHMEKCNGRGGSAKCDLFDEEGNRRCGRCTRANLKDQSVPKTEGLNALTCVGATCNAAHLDCDYYTPRYASKIK